MVTKEQLPSSTQVVERIHEQRGDDIQLDPHSQDAADFLRNLRKLPRSQRVKILFGADPHDYQDLMLDVNLWRDQTRCVAPIGRRGGKTYTGGLIIADSPLAPAIAEDTVVAAPYQRTADEMFTEAMEWYEKSPWPEFFGLETNEFFGIEVDNARTYEFDTGARVMSRTTGKKGKQIRGIGPQVMVVDEAAFVNQRKIYTEVIEPFFATFTTEGQRSEFYLYSTTNGQSGYFYEKWIAASEDAESKWFGFHWPSYINPMISDEWLDGKRAELDSISFAKEYLAEFKDEGNVFIPHSDAKKCQPRTVGETFGLTPPIYAGLDVARGGGDLTALVLVDETGRVEVFDTFSENSIPEIVGLMRRVNDERGYGNPQSIEEIYVESNGVGGGAVDFGAEYDIYNIGEIKSSTQTKHEFYSNLKRRIEEQSLTLPYDKTLMGQLTDLDYTHTPNGYLKVSHRDPKRGDDLPDALALACYAAGGYAPTSRPYNTSSYQPVIG